MEEYFTQLIEHDLALDRKAAITPLHELAAPFRKALKSVTGPKIDHIVANAHKLNSSTTRSW